MANPGEIPEHWAPQMAPQITPQITPELVTQLPYSGSDFLSFLVPYVGLDVDKVRLGEAAILGSVHGSNRELGAIFIRRE